MSQANDTIAHQGQYIQASGLNIHYQEYGNGKPLILLHGMPSNGNEWEEQISLLSPHFRLIIPDARGQGRTNNPSRKIRLNTLADDVIALIQALKLETPFLFGWSTGGDTALNIAIRYPDAVKAMVLGGVILRQTEKVSNIIAGIGIEGPGQVNTEQTKKAWPDFPEIVQTNHPQGPNYWRSLITQLSYEVTEPTLPDFDHIREIETPIQIIWGDRDEFFPVEDAIELYKMIPNAELTVVPNAGHGVCGSHAGVVAGFAKTFLFRHSAPVNLSNENAG